MKGTHESQRTGSQNAASSTACSCGESGIIRQTGQTRSIRGRSDICRATSGGAVETDAATPHHETLRASSVGENIGLLNTVRWIFQILDCPLENSRVVFRVTEHHVTYPTQYATELVRDMIVVSAPPSTWVNLPTDSTFSSLRDEEIIPFFEGDSVRLENLLRLYPSLVFLPVFLLIIFLVFRIFDQVSLLAQSLGIARSLSIGSYLIPVGLAVFSLIRKSAIPALFEGFGTLVTWGCLARTHFRVWPWPGASNTRHPHFIRMATVGEGNV